MVNAPKTEAGLPAVPDEVVDAANCQAGGDPREAVRGLILGQTEIEARLSKQISAGYVRRRP